MRIGVLGLGNMGTAVAHTAAGNGHEVVAWEHFDEVVAEVNDRHRNSRFLEGVALAGGLRATGDPGECAAGAELVLVAVPTPFVRGLLERIAEHLDPAAPVITLAKGLEEDSGMTPRAVAGEALPGSPAGVLSGPSIANELARGRPTVVALASPRSETLPGVVRALQTDRFRLRVSGDPVGVEWGGILKNVYALGLGLLDATGRDSANFLAAFLDAGYLEMTALIEALGGRPETVAGPSGLGDLLATAHSPASHNRRYGAAIGRGEGAEDAAREVGMQPEGLRTLRVARGLAREHGVAMPLLESLAAVFFDGAAPELTTRTVLEHAGPPDAGPGLRPRPAGAARARARVATTDEERR